VDTVFDMQVEKKEVFISEEHYLGDVKIERRLPRYT
jgi:hypothetical protein